jgi:TRAP-type C4-dicarboxylate transport system permease small subunit
MKPPVVLALVLVALLGACSADYYTRSTCERIQARGIPMNFTNCATPAQRVARGLE